MGNSTLALPNKKYSNAQEEFIQFVKLHSKENVPEYKIKTAIERLKKQGYTLVRGIAAGSYGIVIEAKNNKGYHVAIKIMLVRGKLDAQKFQQEADNCWKVQFSQYVAKFHEYFFDESLGLFYLVTDLYLGDTLKKFLKEKDQTLINENRIKEIIIQILKGIIDIHSVNLVHGDLKPENILMDDNGLKICDFGFSKSLNEGVSLVKSAGSTLLYCASEQLKGEIRKESDFFAAGAILFEMCNPTLLHKLRQLKDHYDPKDFKRYKFLELTEIALSMMKVNPKERTTPQEVILKLTREREIDQSIQNNLKSDFDCTLGNNKKDNNEKDSSVEFQNIVKNDDKSLIEGDIMKNEKIL